MRKEGCPKLGRFVWQQKDLPGKVFQQHIDLAVGSDGHLTEGNHIEAGFQLGGVVREGSQRFGRKLDADELQRAVGARKLQPPAFAGFDDQEILLLGGEHGIDAAEDPGTPHDQKQVVAGAGKELPGGTVLEKIPRGCIL